MRCETSDGWSIYDSLTIRQWVVGHHFYHINVKSIVSQKNVDIVHIIIACTFRQYKFFQHVCHSFRTFIDFLNIENKVSWLSNLNIPNYLKVLAK